MISKGNAYTVFKPKDIMVKGEKGVKFSIGNSSFNKSTNSWENKGFINVVAITNKDISDRDKVKITEINSVDTSEYNGKTSVTIFVELEEELNTQENYNSLSSDELPF